MDNSRTLVATAFGEQLLGFLSRDSQEDSKRHSTHFDIPAAIESFGFYGRCLAAMFLFGHILRE